MTLENENDFDLDDSEILMKEMEEYLDEYEIFLKESLSKGTVSKYVQIIGFFIDELNARYGVTGFEQITLGMCGSKFVATFNSHCDESLQLKTTKNTLYKFFTFIYERHGIANYKLLEKLKK